MKVFFTLIFILIASASFSQNIGNNFPEDYPEDMPRPKITVGYPSDNQETQMVFKFDTDVSPKEILNFFKTEMPKAGYQVSSAPLFDEKINGGSGNWKKDNFQVSLLVVQAQENKTFISITFK